MSTGKNFWLSVSASSVVIFLILYRYAGVDSFWLDELIQLSIIRDELSFMDVFNYFAVHELNSPLFSFIAYFWYRIVPHTEQALLSLSIIFVILGAVFTGMTGRNLYGESFGIAAFLLTVFNRVVITGAAYEFRVYGLLVFVSALNIYYYQCRLKHETWSNIILYGATMSLLPYTHYAAVLMCFGFFLVDCILILNKRAGFRVIASYIIGALLFIPWGVYMLIHHEANYMKYFGGFPSISSLMALAKWFTGDISYLSITFIFALIGFIAVIYNAFMDCKDEIIFMCSGLSASVFMVLVVFVYSRFINPEGSIWVSRYFFSLVPIASLFTAYGACLTCWRMKFADTQKNTLCLYMMLILLCLVNLASTARSNNIRQPWEQAAEIIHQEEQDYIGKSAILMTESKYIYYAWEEMYFAPDISHENLPAFSMSDKNTLSEFKSNLYDRIYLSYLHSPLNRSKYSPEIMSWLHENYDFGERQGKNYSYRFQILERRK